MILLVSHLVDGHTVRVLEALRRAGADAVLLDTARIPREVALSVAHAPGGGPFAAELRLEGRWRRLSEEARVVWWRRPLPYALHEEVTGPDERGFAFAECEAAMSGLWASLDVAWMNHPDRDAAAARKLWQLRVADRLGLRTPRTLVTSDPDRARAFAAEEGARGGTIYKAFSATERAWRETRLLRPEEAAMLDAVRYAPVIFQEYVEAALDLRITVVGEEVFAAEILSQQTDYKVDMRMTMHEAEMRPHALPGAVADGLRALLREMGLAYGAVDMRLTPGGEYVFLEVNPAGQWLFVEERTRQPITDAMAAWMAARDGGR